MGLSRQAIRPTTLHCGVHAGQGLVLRVASEFRGRRVYSSGTPGLPGVSLQLVTVGKAEGLGAQAFRQALGAIMLGCLSLLQLCA